MNCEQVTCNGTSDIYRKTGIYVHAILQRFRLTHCKRAINTSHISTQVTSKSITCPEMPPIQATLRCNLPVVFDYSLNFILNLEFQPWVTK